MDDPKPMPAALGELITRDRRRTHQSCWMGSLNAHATKNQSTAQSLVAEGRRDACWCGAHKISSPSSLIGATTLNHTLE